MLPIRLNNLRQAEIILSESVDWSEFISHGGLSTSEAVITMHVTQASNHG
jgi:hypothetical protein